MLSTITFWLPKQGNTKEEYEDSFYPMGSEAKGGAFLRFAVADGAATTMLSKQWARLLVEAFSLMNDDSLDITLLLGSAYESWNRWKEEYTERREQSHRPIQWYEEPGLQVGAYSTFLGLVIETNGRWKAVAVGDSCLFQLRGNTLITSFPIRKSFSFKLRQFLISSNPQKNGGIEENTWVHEGEYRPADRFFLMTDALAGWFLKEYESGGEPWSRLSLFQSPDDKRRFRRWIRELRRKNQIQNDDVTLTSISVF